MRGRRRRGVRERLRCRGRNWCRRRWRLRLRKRVRGEGSTGKRRRGVASGGRRRAGRQRRRVLSQRRLLRLLRNRTHGWSSGCAARRRRNLARTHGPGTHTRTSRGRGGRRRLRVGYGRGRSGRRHDRSGRCRRSRGAIGASAPRHGGRTLGSPRWRREVIVYAACLPDRHDSAAHGATRADAGYGDLGGVHAEDGAALGTADVHRRASPVNRSKRRRRLGPDLRRVVTPVHDEHRTR